jgi:hypothetical protein
MYIRATYGHYNIYAADANNQFSKQKPFKPNKGLVNQNTDAINISTDPTTAYHTTDKNLQLHSTHCNPMMLPVTYNLNHRS